MELPTGLHVAIDAYVSRAIEATGTRRPPRPGTRRPTTELDPEPETDPDRANPFSDEEDYAWQLPALDDVIEPLPRSRAPRGSAAPVPPDIELDDEITAVLSRPA